jgi:hypothetical protein
MEQYIQLGYLCKIWRQNKLTGEQRADAWKPKDQRVFGIFSGAGSLGIGECEKENESTRHGRRLYHKDRETLKA